MIEKIAVVGLACLFPDAQNPEQFWQNLIEGRNSTSNATAAEFGVDPALFYDENGKEKADATYSLRGGYIRDFVFDATGYAQPAARLQGMDPIAKASLYVARQALENSGYWGEGGRQYWDNPTLRQKCGVIMGNLSLPTHHSNRMFGPMYQAAIAPAVQTLLHDPQFHFHPLPCLAPRDGIDPQGIDPRRVDSRQIDASAIDELNARPSSLPAQIITEALDLSPLGFALDAACASSLYAVELASHYLRSGQADMMLAGAASYTDALFIRMLFSGLQAYPDNGVSRPFDQQSRGLTPADGVGMLVLKRYSDAVRDGDTIHAVVAGVGLSNDGRGKHLLSPNQKGQRLAFERAYADAGFSPQAVDYVECHATGTLLGDTTEMQSIDQFFHQAGARPWIGAEKANTGHLLTAAGMVSLIKVILGLEHQMIPPTIEVSNAQRSPNGIVSRDRIVSEPRPWPQTDHPQRAAVNAFGFGGTNAHLIVEAVPKGDAQKPEAQAAPPASPPADPPAIPLAIVGMDGCFGQADGLDALDRGFYDGTQQFRPLPAQRWKGVENQQALLQTYGFGQGAPEGGYIDAVQIDPIRYKIPPNEVGKLHPQQLLMLKVADRALRDAKLQEKDNVAVIIAMETDLSIHQLQQRWNLGWQAEAGLAESGGSLPPDSLEELNEILKDSLHPPAYTSEYVGYIGNIMPSRISALWDFNAPSFTLSAGEDSTLKALEVAQNLLAHGHADAVLVGAVDLAGGFEQTLIRNRVAQLNTGTPTLSFDAQANGSMVGEGAGAVVLKRVEAARQAGDRIYSVVDALSFTRLETEPETAIAQTCAAAYAQAGVSPPEIGYVEVCGSGVASRDRSEILGLTQTYRAAGPEAAGSAKPVDSPDLHCALGSATANLGHTGVAAAMASLIKTSLSLYHRYIPVVPRWSGPQQPEEWQNTPFYVAPESRGWFLDQGIPKRTAALSHISSGGVASHVVLSENPSPRPRSSSYLTSRPFYLFPLAGRDRADLETQITDFSQALENADDLAKLAQTTFRTYRQNPALPYAVTLVGSQKNKLQKETAKALKSLGKAFETGQDWQTPGGSFFTPRPQGQQGKVAFVYPGAFGCFVGQARDRFRLFPEIFELPLLTQLGDRLDRIVRMVYPRSLQAFSSRDRERLDVQLMADPITMFEAESGCSGFTTAVLQDVFQLQPEMALGYSLGETSMMLAQRVFKDEEIGRLSRQLSRSPLFQGRISGPKNAVRDHWGLPLVSVDDGQDLWSNYVLVANPAEVKAAIAQFQRVYLTQINTDKEVVIAGLPSACKQVIELLGCSAFRAPFNHVIHCPPMASEQGEFVKINAMALKPELAQAGQNGTLPVQLYSAATYAPMTLEQQAIGEAIATNLCNPLDFPRLVNRVYDDGARIFVEVGAGGTCSRWISENLGDRPHLTTMLNRRGMDDHSSTVRALARLVSHRARLDLTPLYGDVDAAPAKRVLLKTVSLGGPALEEVILSEANRARFKTVRVDRRQPVTKSTDSPATAPVSARQAPIPNVAIPAPLMTAQLALGSAHDAFLKNRLTGLHGMQQLIEQQLAAAQANLAQEGSAHSPTVNPPDNPPVNPAQPSSEPEEVRS